MVLGPDSSLAALILAVVLPLSAGDPARAVALAGAMAVVSGVLCILAGVLRLGFVTELLSKPIRYGYMNGIALTVLISQLPKLFGFSVEADGPLRSLWAFVQALLGGQDQPDGAGGRRGDAGGDPAAQGPQARAGHPGRRGRRDDRRRRLRPRKRAASRCWARCRRACRRSRSPGSRPPTWCRCCWAARPWRWSPSPTPACCRAPMPRRTGTRVDPNQEMVGPGRRQPGGRPLPGLSDQQQFVAHAGGRGGGRANAVDRRGRRARRCRAAGAGAGPAAPPARQRAGRGGDRLGARPVRGGRPAAHLPHPALGVLAVDRLLRRRGGAGRHPRHRAGDRAGGDRVPVGRLAAAFRRARPGRRRQGLPRHRAPPRGTADPGAGAVPLGRAAVLRQRRVVPRARARRGGRLADAGALARRRRRAGDQRRRHRRRHAGRARRGACTRPASSSALPR